MTKPKIGVQVLGWQDVEQVVKFHEVAQPTVFKTLDLGLDVLRRIKAASPNTLIVGRVFSSSWDNKSWSSESRAKRGAADYWDEVLSEKVKDTGGLVDAWESLNEANSGGDRLRHYAEFEAERARILADHGTRAVVGNFSAGRPDYPEWEFFYPAVAAAIQFNGFVGLHEYSAPFAEWMFGKNQWDSDAHAPYQVCPPDKDAGDTGHLTGRYRRFWRAMPPDLQKAKLIITECLIDGGVNPRPGGQGGGWRDFMSPQKHLEDVKWYNELLNADDFVVGATLFHAGAHEEQWAGFNVLGEALDLIRDYLHSLPATTPAPGGATAPGAGGAAPGGGATPPAGEVTEVGQQILQAGLAKQAIGLNPQAGLQKRILADGFLPVSDEFGVQGADGRQYICQLAQHPSTLVHRAYFLARGPSGTIRFAEGPAPARARARRRRAPSRES